MPKCCIACGGDFDARWARLCRPCFTARHSHPAKLAAHAAVARARRLGLLADPRGLVCTDCSAPAVEYDHREYAKPLEVEPVCRRCNLLRGPAVDTPTWSTSRIKGRRASIPQATQPQAAVGG